jgi:hypothetical protein
MSFHRLGILYGNNQPLNLRSAIEDKVLDEIGGGDFIPLSNGLDSES